MSHNQQTNCVGHTEYIVTTELVTNRILSQARPGKHYKVRPCRGFAWWSIEQNIVYVSYYLWTRIKLSNMFCFIFSADDFNDPIHLERISTLNTFIVRDLGGIPNDSLSEDYTSDYYRINDWY